MGFGVWGLGFGVWGFRNPKPYRPSRPCRTQDLQTQNPRPLRARATRPKERTPPDPRPPAEAPRRAALATGMLKPRLSRQCHTGLWLSPPWGAAPANTLQPAFSTEVSWRESPRRAAATQAGWAQASPRWSRRGAAWYGAACRASDIHI